MQCRVEHCQGVHVPVRVCIYHEKREVPFNGTPHPSHRRSTFKWDIFPSCLLAMRHINKLRKDAERLDTFFFPYRGKKIGCLKRLEALDVVCVCVRAEVKQEGIRDYTKLCGSRREKVNQTLVRSPFQWWQFPQTASLRSIFTCLKTAWSPIQLSLLPPSLTFFPHIYLLSFHYIPSLPSLLSLSLSLCFAQSLSEGDRTVSLHSSGSLRKRPRATHSLFRERLSFLNLF